MDIIKPASVEKMNGRFYLKKIGIKRLNKSN
jgi:hypothetical protein